MSVREYIERLFSVHKCISCREILDYKNFHNALCPECRTEFEVAKTQSCPQCFSSACECSCQPPMLSKEGSLALRKLFFYSADKDTEAQNKLIYFLKKNPNKRGFGFCATQIWGVLKEEIDTLGLDLANDVFIVNVPRSRRSVREYGFDQSRQICQSLADVSNVPYIGALIRKSGGKEQKKLTAAQRRKNLEGRIYPNYKVEDTVNGRYAILFDDVVTTGSSMAVCVKALRKMQIKGVICVTLAADLKNKSSR